MKKTTKLIAIMVIAIMMCLSLTTFVHATDGQKIYINLIYNFLYEGDGDFGVDYTNNTITMYNGQVGKIVEAGTGYGSDNPLEGYDMSIDDESILQLKTTHLSDGYGVDRDEVTITALKEGTTTLVLKAPSDEPASESRTFKVTVLKSPIKSPDDEKLEEIKEGNGLLKLNDKEVDAKYFEIAKKNGIPSLEIVRDFVSWNFDMSKVTDTSIDLMTDIFIESEKPSEIENDAKVDGLYLTFNHDGALPGPATISINLMMYGFDNFVDGEGELNLYYYNPETKSYESPKIASYSNGIVTFELTHCSTYVLTETKLAGGTSTDKGLDEGTSTETILEESAPTETVLEESTSSQTSTNGKGKLDNDPKTGVDSLFAIELITGLSFVGIVITKKHLK